MHENLKQVFILGAIWEIIENASEKDYPNLANADAYCDLSEKRIVIGEITTEKGYEYGDLKRFKNKVLRHEIVHAFLFESGLTQLGQDEQVVEWIAVQTPKMLELFKVLKIIA